MSFLTNLRKAIEELRQDGVRKSMVTVNRSDLKELLYYFDHLDKESRERAAWERKEPCLIQLANAARNVCTIGSHMRFGGRTYLAVPIEHAELLNKAQERTFRGLGIRPDGEETDFFIDYYQIKKGAE